MHIGMSGMVKLLFVRLIESIVSVLKFLSSPVFPGLGFGTVFGQQADWLPGFRRA